MADNFITTTTKTLSVNANQLILTDSFIKMMRWFKLILWLLALYYIKLPLRKSLQIRRYYKNDNILEPADSATLLFDLLEHFQMILCL